ALVRVLLRLVEAIAVTLRILELQRIQRLDVRADLLSRVGIEEPFEPLARTDPKVVIALRTDVEITLELRTVELTGAAGALHPQAFRHRAPPLLGVDTGRHQLVEPAHLSSSSRSAAFQGRAIIAQLDRARRTSPPKKGERGVRHHFPGKRCLTPFLDPIFAVRYRLVRCARCLAARPAEWRSARDTPRRSASGRTRAPSPGRGAGRALRAARPRKRRARVPCRSRRACRRGF